MKIKINIQSFSDIITNSSSELFIINTSMDLYEFEEMWERALAKHGYTPETPYELWDTYRGFIYKDNDGNIVISFAIMCNLDNDMYDWLKNTFGEENVSY